MRYTAVASSKSFPKTFNPKRFDPGEWADLAKLAGMQYVVFTAKHHSGFCMFDTKTTDFDIMNTPYKKDIMETPEQHIPGQPIPPPWEACMTMGTQWQFKPTNESYKSGTELIEQLIETRAKGGNFLLNVGPQPDGPLPLEQTGRLREMALWYFVNQEAVLDVKPWHVVSDGNIWYTQRKDADGKSTVYAMVTQPDWKWGTRKDIVLKSVLAGEQTQVHVLGQTSKVLEYRPSADIAARWEQKPDGLHVSAVRAQRLYNDRTWPNAVVLKITDAQAVR